MAHVASREAGAIAPVGESLPNRRLAGATPGQHVPLRFHSHLGQAVAQGVACEAQQSGCPAFVAVGAA